MQETNEPMIPVFKHYLDTFNVRPLAATECLKVRVLAQGSRGHANNAS
jgi:hypothetical protein